MIDALGIVIGGGAQNARIKSDLVKNVRTLKKDNCIREFTGFFTKKGDAKGVTPFRFRLLTIQEEPFEEGAVLVGHIQLKLLGTLIARPKFVSVDEPLGYQG